MSPQADVLCKVYPPFVNYFEMSKETVNKHDRENPRFHAFLKVCYQATVAIATLGGQFVIVLLLFGRLV